jgi:hypothetical protein
LTLEALGIERSTETQGHVLALVPFSALRELPGQVLKMTPENQKLHSMTKVCFSGLVETSGLQSAVQVVAPGSVLVALALVLAHGLRRKTRTLQLGRRDPIVALMIVERNGKQ